MRDEKLGRYGRTEAMESRAMPVRHQMLDQHLCEVNMPARQTRPAVRRSLVEPPSRCIGAISISLSGAHRAHTSTKRIEDLLSSTVCCLRVVRAGWRDVNSRNSNFILAPNTTWYTGHGMYTGRGEHWFPDVHKHDLCIHASSAQKNSFITHMQWHETEHRSTLIGPRR